MTAPPLRILALEPYYGGSHAAFLDGWRDRSDHEWTVMSLPANKWKWRMRHSAVTFADRIAAEMRAGHEWDILFCSDMLPLAELLGLAPAALRQAPSVAYFHENQLTYPVRHDEPRDLHFAISNMTTALAAAEVWFNSAFHRDSFLDALDEMLARMPAGLTGGICPRIRAASHIQYPGIDRFGPPTPRKPGPMRILWVARWEHDKNPEDFFEALDILLTRGVDFRLSVIGKQFTDSPEVFDTAKKRHAQRIDRWGYQSDLRDYGAALGEADVVVSTADHEFFGISMVEAAAAGAFPVLPVRLAYPEVFQLAQSAHAAEFFYEGGPRGLAEKLAVLAGRTEAGDLWKGRPRRATDIVAHLCWTHRAAELDAAVRSVYDRSRSGRS